MAQQLINIGNVANDRKGDPLRTAFTKTNANIAELYSTLSGINQIQFNGGVISTGISITANTDWADITTTGGATIGRSIAIGNAAYIGAGAKLTSFANPTIVARQSGSTYIQAALVNTNGSGSSDWIAYGDTSDNDHGWGDMGFTGSSFNDPDYTITGEGEAYLFASGYPNGVSHGSLVLCTHDSGILNDIVFGTGGFLAANEKMRFHHSLGQMHIETTTASTSTSTGALRVDGGVGISGNLNVGGTLTLGGSILADTASNVFYVDPSRSGGTYTRKGTFASPYNTVTAAIAAAVAAGFQDSSPAEVILMGNTTENITLKPGVYLTSLGTGTHGSPIINGIVTVTSSTGTTVSNHYSLSNLRIVAPTNGHCILFTGTAPQKLFVRDMWLDANGTGDGIYMDNTGTGSTLQFDIGHLAHSGSGDIYCINVVKGGCYVTDIETSGATQVAAVQTGAVMSIDSSELDANGAVVAETYGTGSITITNSVINNTAANGTGIKLNSTGGIATIGNCLFSIPVGTGYAVQGVSGSLLNAANNVFTTANTARSTAITYNALTTTWSTKT